MKHLTVGDCLWPHIVRVREEDRPQHSDIDVLFAVFKDSIETGTLCGLATAFDISQHPDWIFADLTEHRKLLSIAPSAKVNKALALMNRHGVEAVSVIAKRQFIGVVTRRSILEALLLREHDLLTESLKLKRLIETEHRQILTWAERLSALNDASRTLLSVLANTSIETHLLQSGIEALVNLLQARYGAIGILSDDGNLQTFVHTGIDTEQAQRIGHLPEGKGLLGVVVNENISLRLDDMSRHPQSVGFPPHHPPMKSLLAVPISHQNRVYGRIYLSDKKNGEPFDKNDEELAHSFAHSLSLVLDNAKEMEEVKKARQSLDYVAHFDALTNLPNRSLLQDRALQAISHAQRNTGAVAFLFLDLDNFKTVNDSLGHTLGDRLIQQVGQRIVDCLREGDTAARMGGDEFVVMLPDIGDSYDAAKVACKILAALEQPLLIDQHEIFAGASIGISMYPENANRLDTLLAHADAAMYHAKKLGKNNYQFFTPEMNNAAQQYLRLEGHLRRALEFDELALVYQPQVDIASGRIIGMEALLRWHSKAFGLVAPDQFIHIAEETGLIAPIGAWVLRTACQQAKRWQQQGRPTRIAVNLSGRQFQLHHTQAQYHLLTLVLNVLNETDLPPELLELEITESILMQHLETTLNILDQLKNHGIRISIDDFGTGYSSLSYLKRFPLDTLKIDKSFVNDISTDPNDRAIVAAITAMAQQLKLEVVAEGVETSEQLAFLRHLSCHYVQGYYFSKPVPPEQAFSLLQQGYLPELWSYPVCTEDN